MCLSSAVNEKAFSSASHGHILITPPSDPDHKSPENQNRNKIQSKHNKNKKKTKKLINNFKTVRTDHSKS
jgi:hypothetical protein